MVLYKEHVVVLSKKVCVCVCLCLLVFMVSCLEWAPTLEPPRCAAPGNPCLEHLKAVGKWEFPKSETLV